MNEAFARQIGRMGRRQSRKRQRLIFAGGAALSLAVAATLSVASLSGVDVASAAAAKAQSFLDLMRQRSPGERTEAHLNKIKHKHYAVMAERALPDVPALAPYRPPAAILAEALQPQPALLAPATPVLAQAPLLPTFYTPPGGGVFVTPPPGVPGGPGIPGGPGGPPSAPPDTPPSTTPSVPEPGSWAMMIMGFGIAGFALRRRNGDRRPAVV